ncbi:MAG: biliverdin-producing heme oxygenase [Burkholderiales bacterium]|jgi:heme oxygenase|nr:biliverdin-producing heme oxygenase [Burkholderiales bacterium]
MTLPPAAEGLGSELRAATAAMHRRVERTPYMAGLLRGQLDRRQYVQLLQQLQVLYAALEEALQQHAATPGVAPVVLPELFRHQALTEDLRALGSEALAPARQTHALQAYVARLKELAATKPALLVAHAYVRYLGDLNGGQALRQVVRRALALQGGMGTQFYDFGEAAARRQLEQRFRDGLEQIGPQWKDRTPLLEEAVSAFTRHEQLFAELASA